MRLRRAWVRAGAGRGSPGAVATGMGTPSWYGTATARLVAVTLVLAGCAGGSAGPAAPAPTGPQPHPSPATEDPMTTGTASAPPGSGRAISRSDVSGLPDSELASGAVIFVAERRAADVAAAAGLDPSDTDGMRHASFVLDAARVADLAAAVAPIAADGRFPVSIPGGRYLVCLADIFPDHTAGPPHSVIGCAAVDVPEPARTVLTVWFGEGGVEATLD